MQVALFIKVACVAGDIPAFGLSEILLDEFWLIAPESKHERGRQGQLRADPADRLASDRLVAFVHYLYLVARRRLGS